MGLVPADALVVRFAPNSSEGLRNRALKEHRRSGYYRVPAFADVARDGEDDEALIERLLAAAELSGIDPARNEKYWLCTQAEQIYGLNLSFTKDGFDGEVDEHFSIEFEAEPSVEDTARLSEVFESRRRNL